MSDLPIHVIPEDESDNLDIDLEVIDDMISNDLILREEIEERMDNYKTGLEALFVLEDYHTTMYSKTIIDDRDIKQLNIITKAINANLNHRYDGFNIATEGLADLVKSASATTANAASNVINAGSSAGKMVGTAGKVVVSGVVKATELSKVLVDKINQGIINLASEYDIIAKLIEKRWFGVKNLIEVYRLQVSKLEDRVNEATNESNSLRSDIKVKLNTAKLSRDRKISTKNDYMKIIREDVTAIVDFLNAYTQTIKLTEGMSKDTAKSIAFMTPYKQTMVKNLNLFNLDVLGKLGDEDIFKGGHDEGNEKHSRVLIGGKRVSVSFNRDRATLLDVRSDLRRKIREMNIYGSRVKGNDNINVEVITLRDFTYGDAKELLSLLKTSGEALDRYNGESIPKLIKDRQFFSRVTEMVTGLAVAVTGFGIIKNFLSNGNNLEAVKKSLPGNLLSVIDLFVKAASLTALVGLAGAKLAGALVDWLRKYIISSIFTSIDLQYRITKIMNNVDSSVIDTLISVRGQCYRVTEKLSRPKVWV